MSVRLTMFDNFGAVLAMLFICSCVATHTPESAYNDKEKYLSDYFSVSGLPAEIDKIHHQTKDVVKTFKKMKIFYKTVFEKNGQNPIESNIHVTSYDAGNGYLLQVRETYINNIPTRLSYNINYMDFLQYRWQGIMLTRSGNEPIFEIKKILKFNPFSASPEKGDVYEFEYNWGPMEHSRVDGTSLVKFIAADRVQAGTVFSGLKGDAVIMNGERIVRGNIIERSKVLFLVDYGVILQKEITTAYAKMSYEVVNMDMH